MTVPAGKKGHFVRAVIRDEMIMGEMVLDQVMHLDQLGSSGAAIAIGTEARPAHTSSWCRRERKKERAEHSPPIEICFAQ